MVSFMISFFCGGPHAKYLGFVGRMVSISTLQLSCSSWKLYHISFILVQIFLWLAFYTSVFNARTLHANWGHSCGLINDVLCNHLTYPSPSRGALTSSIPVQAASLDTSISEPAAQRPPSSALLPIPASHQQRIRQELLLSISVSPSWSKPPASPP